MDKHWCRIVVTAMLVLGLGVQPSFASVNDTGVLAGTASVGKTFWSSNDCDKTGDATVVGEGLYFKGSPLDSARARHAVWHLKATITSFTFGPFDLEACGWMGALDGTVLDRDDRWDGVGAACGASKGHNGMGEFRTAGGIPLAKLMHLGWKTSVGGVIVVTGAYQEYQGGLRDKVDKQGSVAFKLFTAGGAACFDPPGAQAFAVAGTYALVNGAEAPRPPKFQEKECKQTDPNMDKHKDTTGTRPCPTAKK